MSDDPIGVMATYAEAMQRSGVPSEPLQVYDSNSWRRVGLKARYKTVMRPYVATDGHPDIDGDGVLRALVAAFNAMPVAIELIETLRAICEATAQAYSVWEDWRGAATTQQATLDSWYRVAMMLQAAKFDTGPRRDDLDWRGSILHELNEAGFFVGADGKFHLDPQRRVHGDAQGPTLQEVASSHRPPCDR